MIDWKQAGRNQEKLLFARRIEGGEKWKNV